LIRLTFECPDTGKPLSGTAIEDWTGEAPDALIAMLSGKSEINAHFNLKCRARMSC